MPLNVHLLLGDLNRVGILLELSTMVSDVLVGTPRLMVLSDFNIHVEALLRKEQLRIPWA